MTFRFDLKAFFPKLFITVITTVFCLPTTSLAAAPIRVIFDHDGAFEDYYALLVLALASQLDSPPVKLIGVTTMAHGESYCNGSNGYPDLKQAFLRDFSPEA